MLVYLGFLLFLLILTLVSNELVKDKKLRAKIITGISLFAIFLLYVLKDYSVGSDTSAYYSAYEQMKNVPFNDFNTMYMEKGYQLLMKVCILANLDFRWFLVITYAISITPLYYLITKYSENPSLSVLTYFCYQFFVFSMSGIRQTLSLGLCTFAFMVLECKGKWKYLLFALLVFIGFTFHKSALVFIFVPLIRKLAMTKLNLIFFFLLFGVFFVFRGKISYTIMALTGYKGSFTIGLNYFLVLALILVSILVYWYTNNLNEIKKPNKSFTWFKLSFYALILHTVLYPSVLLRAVNLLTIYFILLIPSIVGMFKEKTQKLLNILISFGLVSFFILTVLKTNQLEIVPYKFFWQ